MSLSRVALFFLSLFHILVFCVEEAVGSRQCPSNQLFRVPQPGSLGQGPRWSILVTV